MNRPENHINTGQDIRRPQDQKETMTESTVPTEQTVYIGQPYKLT